MFDVGNILYCQNFQFNNGNQPKAKYFIVLKRDNDGVIVGSLPTRTSKIPNFVNVSHGCINKNERLFNCYLFQAGKLICENSFCFDLPTFVYGDEVELYDVKVVEKNYVLNVNYVVEGKLKDEEFKALMECFKSSDAVKNKIRKRL